MCDQRNKINSRNKYHKFRWRIQLPFSSSATYCTPLKKTDFLTFTPLTPPLPPNQMMNVSAATSSNTMSTSYHLRVEGISAVQRFPPGSCLNFRGEIAHICSLRIRETAPQEKSFACNKHGLCRCYFRGCFYAFVCFLMDQARLWNYKEKLSLDISRSVVDASFSKGLVNLRSRYSLLTIFTPYTGRWNTELCHLKHTTL